MSISCNPSGSLIPSHVTEWLEIISAPRQSLLWGYSVDVCFGSVVKVADSLVHHSNLMGSFYEMFKWSFAFIKCLLGLFITSSKGRLGTWTWKSYIQIFHGRREYCLELGLEGHWCPCSWQSDNGKPFALSYQTAWGYPSMTFFFDGLGAFPTSSMALT